jgi:predicted nicotinamide N-methyase
MVSEPPIIDKAHMVSSLAVIELDVGGRKWSIGCVHDQDALLSASNRHHCPPYGLLLWDSAIALAEFIASCPELVTDKRVLELGAGVGLPGLVAQSVGAHVAQTDYFVEALNVAALNAAGNGVTGIKRFWADWRNWQSTDVYDVVLGADILYDPEVHAELAGVIKSTLAPKGTLILADPGRPQALEFLSRLGDEGHRFELQTRRVGHASLVGSGEIDVLLASATSCQPD